MPCTGKPNFFGPPDENALERSLLLLTKGHKEGNKLLAICDELIIKEYVVRKLPSQYGIYSDLLVQGVDKWNEWRRQNPKAKINLANIELCYIDLPGINFSDVILDHCKLKSDSLRGADFRRASLRYGLIERCTLDGAIFTDAKSSFTIIKNSRLDLVVDGDGLRHALSNGPRTSLLHN